MTEVEALKKWCPYGRTPAEFGHDTFIQNRTEIGDPDAGSLCIGSRCMAWRQSQIKNPAWKPSPMMQMYPAQHPADETPMYVPDKRNGYCGAFQRPGFP